MRGKIVVYNREKEAGAIATDDRQRFIFHLQDWQEVEPPEPGMTVDFELDENKYPRRLKLVFSDQMTPADAAHASQAQQSHHPHTKGTGMLGKLENVYLAILRFVVIVIASVFLMAFLILGFSALKTMPSKLVLPEVTPEVSAQDLIKGITEQPAASEGEPQKKPEETKKPDTNAVFYTRAVNVIATFVTKNSDGTLNIDKDKVTVTIKQLAEAEKEPRIIAAFAKNFSESIEKTLADPSVIKVAKDTSPLDVVNKIISLFVKNFDEQIRDENIGMAADQQEHDARKAAAMQSLYIAAGAFGIFLVIVFLSIIIKIERNLRYLENLPSMMM